MFSEYTSDPIRQTSSPFTVLRAFSRRVLFYMPGRCMLFMVPNGVMKCNMHAAVLCFIQQRREAEDDDEEERSK